MIFCFFFGHRYDYAIKRTELHAIVCTRCGDMRVLEETKLAVSPADLARAQQIYDARQQQFAGVNKA